MGGMSETLLTILGGVAGWFIGSTVGVILTYYLGGLVLTAYATIPFWIGGFLGAMVFAGLGRRLARANRKTA